MAQGSDRGRVPSREYLSEDMQPFRQDYMSPELFERICRRLEAKYERGFRKKIGNPTPIALVGILLSLAPLSCDLLGLRGAEGDGAADNGAYFGFGGILTIGGGFFELILGNTFSAVVFASYGAFFFTYGATLTPAFAAISSYQGGESSTSFQASFGFFTLWMAILSFLFLIASTRLNIVLVLTFLSLFLGFSLFTASHWNAASGNMDISQDLLRGGAAFVFVTHLVLWYDFFMEILVAADFPLKLPVGDLSMTSLHISVTSNKEV